MQPLAACQLTRNGGYHTCILLDYNGYVLGHRRVLGAVCNLWLDYDYEKGQKKVLHIAS